MDMESIQKLRLAVLVTYVCLGFMIAAGVVYTNWSIQRNNKLSCGTLEIIIRRTSTNTNLADINKVYVDLYKKYGCSDVEVDIQPIPTPTSTLSVFPTPS